MKDQKENTTPEQKPNIKVRTPEPWLTNTCSKVAGVRSRPSHLCIDHDPLKTSFRPPLLSASENHLVGNTLATENLSQHKRQVI